MELVVDAQPVVSIPVQYTWDERQIKAVKLIQNRASAMVWLHDRSKKFYTALNKIVAALFGIGSMVGGGNVVPLIVNGSDQNTIIIISAVIILFGAATTILAVLGWEEIANHHSAMAKSNSLLHLKCAELGNKQNIEVTDPDNFIHDILKDEYMIYTEFVSIPRLVVWRYRRVFGIKALSEEILFRFHTWDILTDPDVIADPEVKVVYSGIVGTSASVKKIRKINCWQSIRYAWCRRPRSEVLPEHNVSSTLLPITRDGHANKKLLDHMAQLEHTISIISTEDIMEVMNKHRRPSLLGTPVKFHQRHNLSSVEIYEQERMQNN